MSVAIVLYLILFPLIGIMDIIIHIIYINREEVVNNPIDVPFFNEEIRRRAVFYSFLVFITSLLLLIPSYGIVDPIFIDYFSFSIVDSHFYLNFTLVLDQISILFIILTTLLIFICCLISTKINKNVGLYFILFLILDSLLIITFLVSNLFYFFMFFESVLIPMFLIIGIWGSRSRKIKASYYFFLYTLFGSLLMLVGLMSIYLEVGSLDLFSLVRYNFSLEREKILWLSLFIAFAIKIPMFPFHIWLPEAHVEAPTAGSVLLAGLLLKLGGYGFIRFLIQIFNEGTVYYMPLVFTLSILGLIYSSLTILCQIDLKKIIAYSSIAHMNFCLLGLFSLTQEGLQGSILLMLGHGFVSSALFILVGILYDRYKERVIWYYGGIAFKMPIFSIFFFFFSLANFSFPGTSNFIGELTILIGLVQRSTFILLISGFGIILSTVYSIWLYNRVCFGTLKLQNLLNFKDLDFYEIISLSILLFFMLLMGFKPNLFLDFLHPTLFLFEKGGYYL